FLFYVVALPLHFTPFFSFFAGRFRDLLEVFCVEFVPLIPSQSKAEGRGKERGRGKGANGEK
ncbi:MAG: hypothetical protein ACK56P_14385, partial [Chitinophagales bacterium]